MIGGYYSNCQQFNANNVASSVLWLDARDPAANGVQPANASALATWVDKSGKGNNATQAVGAAQPLFTTSAVNGLPGITFNGVASVMNGTMPTMAANPLFSIYMVAKYIATVGTDVWMSVGSVVGAGTTTDMGCNTGANKFTIFDLGVSDSNFVPKDTNVHQFTYLRDSATNLLTLNVDKQPPTSNTGAPAAMNDNTSYALGALFTGNFANCYLCEIIVYLSILSAAKDAYVVNYLKQKWATP